jgi:hypothetical protein
MLNSGVMMKLSSEEHRLFLEQSCRSFDQQWHAELLCAAPDWEILFELHFGLVQIERQMRRLRRSR